MTTAILDTVDSVQLPATVLRNLCSAVAFARADSVSRYALNGILLRFTPDTIEAIATDARQLARRSVENPRSSDYRGDLFLPGRVVDGILASGTTAKLITISQTGLVVKATWTQRNGEKSCEGDVGRFPRLDHVEPTSEVAATLAATVEELLFGLPNPENPVYRVREAGRDAVFSQYRPVLTVHAMHKEWESNFNVALLREWLTTLAPELDVVITFRSDNSAIVCTAGCNRHHRAKYLLMPCSGD